MKLTSLSLNILALGLASSAFADSVFTDDIIAQVNLCVGTSCADGETFAGGFPLKLHANAVGIDFDDNAGNADNDWAIRINSSTQEFFAIEDATLGLTAFQIFAGSGPNAIVVEPGGDVGMGTSLPDADLHVLDAGIASLIIESVSENAAWEMAVSSTGLILLDKENGTAPMVIENGAPLSSFRLSGTGQVGLGTDAPASALHIQRSDGTGKILVEETGGSGAQELFQLKSNGGSYFTFSNTTSGRDWFFNHENAAQGRFIITSSTNPSQGLFYSPNGNMQIGGVLTQNSDKHAKMAIEPVDSAEILEKVAALPVSAWTYKDDASGARHVGPMAQDFHAAFGLGETETGISTLDTSGIALASIKALHAQNEAQAVLIEQLMTRLAALEARQ